MNPQTLAILTAHRENQELRQKFLKDFYQEKTVKKMGFQLMKNTDAHRLKIKKYGINTEREVQNSQDLKYSF